MLEQWKYQAVHKAIRELLATGAIVHEEGRYKVCSPWADKQLEWWTRIAEGRAAKNPPHLAEIPADTVTKYVFTGVIGVPYWVIDQVPLLLSPGNPIREHWYFGWPAQMVGPESTKR